MPELESLRSALSQLNSRLIQHRLALSVGSMGSTAAELERKHGEGRPPDQEIVMRALRRFLQKGEFATYADLKSTCFGILERVDGGSNVVAQPHRLRSLLEAVDRVSPNPKKLQRCLRGLLGAYFQLDGVAPASAVHQQWAMLRGYLEKWLPIVRCVPHAPEWLIVADGHRNLFSCEPTARYGNKLLQGDRSEFDEACRGLEIKESSWVTRRAIISTIEAATSASDHQFAKHLNKLITLLAGHQVVRIEGAVKVLDRYAQMASCPEQANLRMFAVETFGNPLVVANRPHWANVSPGARDMVSGWLKGFLIERFFELLTQDGQSDKRRPKFWQRYRNSIEGMWFVLGANARSNYNIDFKKLRDTMGDQCLALDGGGASNNAFIMKLGHLYVVEFGARGNATYIFDANDLPFDLARRSLSLTGDLKSSKYIDRLTHMDGLESWETKFSNSLFQLATLRPDSTMPQRRQAGAPPSLPPATPTLPASRPPTSTQFTDPLSEHQEFLRRFQLYCARRSLRVEDLRELGGPIVVHTDDRNSEVTNALSSWGFVYQRGKLRWVRE